MYITHSLCSSLSWIVSRYSEAFWLNFFFTGLQVRSRFQSDVILASSLARSNRETLALANDRVRDNDSLSLSPVEKLTSIGSSRLFSACLVCYTICVRFDFYFSVFSLLSWLFSSLDHPLCSLLILCHC